MSESGAITGDPRFKGILDEMWALHCKKGADYGSDKDIFANVKAAQEFGVAPWVAAMVRGHDKVVRLQSFARKGLLENESAEDSLIDLAAYAVIALILMREESGQ